MLVRAPGRLRDAGPQGGRGGQPAARARPGQAAGRRRDDRLGAHPRACSARPTSTPDASTDTLGAVVKERDDLELVRANLDGIAVRCLTARPFVGDAGRLRRRAARGRGSRSAPATCSPTAGAMAPLDPTDLLDLYWAGRTTLVTRRDQIPVYDRVFRSFFLDEADDLPEPLRAQAARAGRDASRCSQVPETEPRHRRAATSSEAAARPGRLGRGRPAEQGLRAPARPRSWPRCGGSCARMRLTPPRRRTRRTAPAPLGPHARPAPHGPRDDAHARRAVDAVLAPAPAAAAPADPDPRRLRLDGRLLAQPAAVRATRPPRAPSRVEVFCFGTRLTRITRALERRRPDDAMEQAAAAVFDWEGGTRIGDVARRRSCATGAGAASAGAGSW